MNARQWRPIETAVNEGSILAWVPTYYQGQGAAVVAHWMDWKEPGCGWYDNRAWLVEPTHWQPLPPPPGDDR